MRIIRLLALLSITVTIMFGSVLAYRHFMREPQPEVYTISDEMVIIRTMGGWLEVSTIKSNEVFFGKVAHEIFGISLGETTTQIRVPAHFTYRIPLAPEWRVLLRGEELLVVAPNVQPALPVAVDLSKMQKSTGGPWSTFTGPKALDQTERMITAKLESRAKGNGYVNFQREAARTTVSEFLRKWFITQAKWQHLEGKRIRVLFADEPLESLGPQWLPQIQP